jgi:hypothetical protein
VAEHPESVRRRLLPDPTQVQIILGSLMGQARVVGPPCERYMTFEQPVARAEYLWWKYEHLAVFAGSLPITRGRRIRFRTIIHPLFDDLVPLLARPRGIGSHLLTPLGLAIWMTDVGRLDARRDLVEVAR